MTPPPPMAPASREPMAPASRGALLVAAADAALLVTRPDRVDPITA